jgi:lactate dehydrogenase-like 2-hydroxyacid dehydrogenase
MRNPAACRDSGDLFSKVLRISASRSSRRNEKRSGNAGVGKLTETWKDTLFAALKAAGGHAYSNYGAGYNNVDVAAATRHGIAVGKISINWATSS